MSFNQRPQKEYTPDVFTDSKLKLYGKPLQEGGWATSIRVKMVGNNPAIEASTGLKDKKGRLIRIDTPMSPVTFDQLLSVIEIVASSKTAQSFELENWGHAFNWDASQQKSVRAEERSVLSRFSVERTEAGLIRLSVANKFNTVTVDFVQDDWHKWMKDGEYVKDEQFSGMVAKSWARTIRKIYADTFVNTWTEPEFEKKRRLERIAKATGNQGGGSYGGNNSYSNNTGNRPSAGPVAQAAPQHVAAPAADNLGFDDDLPF